MAQRAQSTGFSAVVAAVVTAVAAVAAVTAAACSGASPGADLGSGGSGANGNASGASASGGAAANDAGVLPDPATDAGLACSPSDSTTRFVCAADGLSRRKCAGGSLVAETCARGCLRNARGADDTCLATTSAWSCTGSYGKDPALDGDYYITAFGCWTDASGVVHGDPGDNCIPSCLAQAKAAGLCPPGDTGKDCESRLTWFTADAARFGCLARVRVEDPKTGKAAIAVALDNGPGCSVESSVHKAVLDTSGRVDRYLFGADQGASDKTLVHVVEVDPSTPLGPVP